MNKFCRYIVLTYAMLLMALNMPAQHKITILHTNDMHSSVPGSETKSDVPGTGGLAAIAGIQEGKVWGSVVTFAESFDDTNNNGIPDVPDRYR